MKIAVLAGTGRTGRRLVRELLGRGHAVSVLARDPGPLRRDRPLTPGLAALLAVLRGAIRPEERFLRQRFGPAHHDYARRVPRWP